LLLSTCGSCRARRQELASIAHSYKVGQPIPYIDYTQVEKDTWYLQPQFYMRAFERIANVTCVVLDAVGKQSTRSCLVIRKTVAAPSTSP
jgi:hypothetical protein